MKTKILVLLLVLNESFCFSQNDSTFYYFNRFTPEKIILSKINKTKESHLKDYYNLIYYSKLRELDSISSYIKKIENSKTPLTSKVAEFYYFKAYYNKIIDNDSLAFKYHEKALSLAKKSNDSLVILHTLSGLSQSWDYNDENNYRLDYLNELGLTAEKFNNNSFKIIHPYLLGNYYLLRDKNKLSVNSYKRVLELDFKSRDSTIYLYTLNNLGALYNDNLVIPDSAIYFYNKKLDLINKNKKFQYPNNYFDTYKNLGVAYASKKDFKNAKKYYDYADSISINENILWNKLSLAQNRAILNSQIEDYKSAYFNLNTVIKLSDSLKEEEHRESITRIKEEVDNEKLRADNAEIEAKRLESESKQKRTNNLLISSLALLFFSGIIFILIQKNTKRKQKLAEQDKEIETQKLATVLKEQELTTIDAMIAGQEKERQRIANDLHDDLGGLMANVKLHFNALKDKESPDLFNKTNVLIDEAYNKVRSIAHAKNSGVIAKQGLLKAVQNMADKVSASNKIQIDVVDHGLENRLENSLELTIFRIIQELITNIIKHAQATETTIHLTNHKDALNIMVEDNGRGFNAKQITKINKGMGISSIDKRVEHLNGKLTIESEMNKGTTIIIDLPI